MAVGNTWYVCRCMSVCVFVHICIYALCVYIYKCAYVYMHVRLHQRMHTHANNTHTGNAEDAIRLPKTIDWDLLEDEPAQRRSENGQLQESVLKALQQTEEIVAEKTVQPSAAFKWVGMHTHTHTHTHMRMHASLKSNVPRIRYRKTLKPSAVFKLVCTHTYTHAHTRAFLKIIATYKRDWCKENSALPAWLKLLVYACIFIWKDTHRRMCIYVPHNTSTANRHRNVHIHTCICIYMTYKQSHVTYKSTTNYSANLRNRTLWTWAEGYRCIHIRI